MSLKQECVPVVGVREKDNGVYIKYIVDQIRRTQLRPLHRDKGVVTCALMSDIGRKCQGRFPCWINETDMYTTVVPESNQ